MAAPGGSSKLPEAARGSEDDIALQMALDESTLNEDMAAAF